MGVPIVAGILAAIRAGVPAAKLIVKYGKKLYNKAKADIKKSDKIDIENKEWIKSSNLIKAGLGLGTTGAVVKAVEKKLEKNKGGPIRMNKGGPIDARKIAKKYFKGVY